MATKPILLVEDVRFSYRGAHGIPEVLAGISFRVNQGEFVSILGPNGSGKSTLLRLLAGMQPVLVGKIELSGLPIDHSSTKRAMVFQDFGLFNWMTVRDNVAFGLKAQGVSSAERYERAQQYITRFGLDQHADKYPLELSGGLKQRTAIARALIVEPALLLLDEPFGALDSQVRKQLHELMISISEREGVSVVMVTHDYEEAVLLSDRVLVMSAAPSVISREIPISLPRPRSLSIRFDPSFQRHLEMIEEVVLQ